MILWLACSVPTFSPPPDADHASLRAAGEVTRFIAVGDTGKGNDTQRAVAAGIKEVCRRRGCDFALLLGDNLYPDGMVSDEDPRMDEVFTQVYGELGLEFHAVLGNHDYGRRHLKVHADRQIAWATGQPLFHLPAPYYRFEAGPAGFWALDTDAVFWTGLQPQAGWLDETLGPSDVRWKVVFGHHPWLSNGKHGNAGTYEGWSGVPYSSGSALRELFENHLTGADLYLAGHDHNLQLLTKGTTTLVVSGAGASTTPIVDRGNQPALAFDVPGFAWIELGEAMTVAFHGADGALLGEQVVPKSSSLERVR